MDSPNRRVAQTPTCPRDAAGNPLRFRGAEGAYLVDEDGERWIDLDAARGSVFLGHAHPAVVAAVSDAVAGERGASTSWHAMLDEVVEAIATSCGASRIALYRTGTACVRAAVTSVVAAQGRPLVLSSGYHGYDPMWEPIAPFAPNADGIVDFFFDLDALEDLLARHQGRVAAVVVSPDHIHLREDWYRDLGRIVGESEAALVLDEVKTGFRYGPGLSTAGLLAPDVWCVAKGLANGAPLSAVGGNPRLLAPMAEVSYTSYFDPVVLAAAAATLDIVTRPDTARRLERRAIELTDALRSSLQSHGVGAVVAGSGPLFQIVASDDEVERALHVACQRERLLLYEGDNQSPSLAFDDPTVVADAAARFDRACAEAASSTATAPGAPDVDAYYRAAWNLLDGLPDRPREGRSAQDWIDRLSEDVSPS